MGFVVFNPVNQSFKLRILSPEGVGYISINVYWDQSFSSGGIFDIIFHFVPKILKMREKSLALMIKG